MIVIYCSDVVHGGYTHMDQNLPTCHSWWLIGWRRRPFGRAHSTAHSVLTHKTGLQSTRLHRLNNEECVRTHTHTTHTRTHIRVNTGHEYCHCRCCVLDAATYGKQVNRPTKQPSIQCKSPKWMYIPAVAAVIDVDVAIVRVRVPTQSTGRRGRIDYKLLLELIRSRQVRFCARNERTNERTKERRTRRRKREKERSLSFGCQST